MKEAVKVAGITIATLYVAQWVHGFVAATPMLHNVGLDSDEWLPALVAFVALYCLLP